jgi:metallo-beta-lactamase family protein
MKARANPEGFHARAPSSAMTDPNVRKGVAPILQFLGGAGTVTGSRFLLATRDARVLVDCGLFQGGKQLRLQNWAPFPVDPAGIDAVVLTHAHLDHCGYLPALVRDGFAGPVFCSRYTAELATIVLDDSARLQEEEAAYASRHGYSKHRPPLPLYTQDDARRAEGRLEAVAFDESVDVAPGIRAVLRPAGHILGSATVALSTGHRDRTLLFTGDLGRPNHPLLRPPVDPCDADVVVTESTYGNRHHDEASGIDTLASAITRTAERGGMVVIPAFAVDRTEVVLMALGRLGEEGRIPRLPIYADSPMALAVLDVYRDANASGGVELRNAAGTDPFDGAGPLHAVRSPLESRALNDLRYPSIIISASGMATGGRVLHHLAHRLPDPRNTIVLAGFQAAGTRGQQLADRATSVKLLGHYVPVRADVIQIGAFSAHADADELVAWHGRSPRAPDATYIVHGEPHASEALQQRLTEELGWNAVVPNAGERVRVD